MIEWKKIEAGEYEDAKGRFHIMKSYDRIYGDHWVLHDRSNPDYYKGKYDEKSLQDCKKKAETLLKTEVTRC